MNLRVACVMSLSLAAFVGGCHHSTTPSGNMVITPGEGVDARTFDYKIVSMNDANAPLSPDELDARRAAARKDLEGQGWEYVGTEVATQPGKPTIVLFRKAKS
jgi:hypothetical protein